VGEKRMLLIQNTIIFVIIFLYTYFVYKIAKYEGVKDTIQFFIDCTDEDFNELNDLREDNKNDCRES
jgi:TM2 domain-containing membrane protein YozV